MYGFKKINYELLLVAIIGHLPPGQQGNCGTL